MRRGKTGDRSPAGTVTATGRERFVGDDSGPHHRLFFHIALYPPRLILWIMSNGLIR